MKRFNLMTQIAVSAAIAFFMVANATKIIAQENDLQDSDISMAVETNLLLDEGVSAHLVDVDTTDGVVTLSGTVDNILAKERALKITESIKGVRSVINRITVKPVERNDEQIKDDIVNALLFDPATDSYELNVKVDDGTVTLTGTVQSWSEKELAENVVKGVKGVTDVNNDIDIQYESDRADIEIENEIDHKLSADPYVDDGLIDVSVTDGAVTLTGTVGSAAEKSQARVDAWVAGVQSVDATGLEVKWWARDEMQRKSAMQVKSDENIKNSVQDALFYDPRVASFNLDVTVDAGIVTLTGVVDNLKAKKSAAQDARNTTGVWKVNNHIRVRPVDAPTDNQIAENVRESLLWDPFVERYELDVTVRNNKVYLYGTVDTNFEKNQAEDIASRVFGVVDVENNLNVSESWAWKTDREIKQDIESQLFWSPFVDSDKISVSVENGVATLTGAVSDLYEHDVAVENAFEGGARGVISNLDIRSENIPGYSTRQFYPDIFYQEFASVQVE